MTLKRKTRNLPFGGGYSVGSYDSFNSSTGQWDNGVRTPYTQPTYIGNQITDSETHQWPPPKGNTGDIGGDFYSVKVKGNKPNTHFAINKEVPWNFGVFTKKRARLNFSLSCPIETIAGKPAWPTAQSSSTSSLNALGAKAISFCSPVSSAVELGTALGEIYRDGLPAVAGSHTWEKRTLKAKESSNEFLNIQFGWLPLVSDMQDLGRAIARSDAILTQYDADRGKTIRRSYSFPVEKSTQTVSLGLKSPDGISVSSVLPGTTDRQGIWVRTTTTTKRRWFAGAFRYGVPMGSSSRSNIASLAQKADLLTGLVPTPEFIWNLTPWSWATDWALNTGDVLANVSDFALHGLIMQYGYMMEETIVNVTYSLTGTIINGVEVSVPDASLVVTTKKRVRANPFGFGITWDGLSATQTAILAALGISRS